MVKGNIMEDNYPKGIVYTKIGKEIEAIRIELHNNYIVYKDTNLDKTVMLPNHMIDHIKYENIPKEIIEQRMKDEQGLDTTKSDNN